MSRLGPVQNFPAISNPGNWMSSSLPASAAAAVGQIPSQILASKPVKVIFETNNNFHVCQ